MTGRHHSAAALAGGRSGPRAVSDLVAHALAAVASVAGERGGPSPAQSPAALIRAMTGAGEPALPEGGRDATEALVGLARMLAEGSADPGFAWCAGHLHTPPLAVACAADTVAAVLNPSLDSWDQAPAASVIEAQVQQACARLVYPRLPDPAAVLTTGGTDSTLTGLLMAREHHPGLRVVCGANAHHSVARVTWMLGLDAPEIVRSPDGRMDVRHLARVLAGKERPTVVVATAGTTDAGVVDPLSEIGELARRHGAWYHVDAAYGGALRFSDRLSGRLAGIELADTVTLDLHKLGWQPLAAGVLVAREASLLEPLSVRADYLNATDDTEAGVPDLLGRSWRTSRRADAFKIAVTFQALGRRGLAAMVEHCCDTASEIAARIGDRPGLRLWAPPVLSTVLFRPAAGELTEDDGDELVADMRRRLFNEGTAVLGRATMPGRDGGSPGRLWLKLTILHPHATADTYDNLLDLVETRAASWLASRSIQPSTRGGRH